MPLSLHTIKSNAKKPARKRVGRGNASGKGTYATRGIKGQRSRSGGRRHLKKRSAMRQIIKKIPKLGGFKSLKAPATALTLATLDKHFEDGDTIHAQALLKKGLIKKATQRTKIVGNTPLAKKFTIEKMRLTPAAQKVVEEASGEIK